jgi:hypothetical protein
MCVPITKRSSFRHVHHAMVAATPAAARGQTRLRTGRNERYQRPEPVQEDEANTRNATHGAPTYREVRSNLDLCLGYSQFLPQSRSVVLRNVKDFNLDITAFPARLLVPLL